MSLLLALSTAAVLTMGAWAPLFRHAWPRALALSGSVAWGVVLYRGGLPWLVRRLERRSLTQRRAWLGAVSLLALLLLVAAPIHVLMPAEPFTLTLRATGERNPQSQGSEVWVLGLLDAHGTRLSPKGWRPEGNWERRNGDVWLSHLDQPALLHWEARTRGPLVLQLLTHDHSGIIEYTVKGRTERIDLYSPPGTDTRRDVVIPDPVALFRGDAALQNGLVLAAHALVLATLLLMAGLWLTGREARVSEPVSPRRAGLLAPIPFVVVAGVWLLAVYPGMLSPDSTSQWRDALSGHMDDAHPLFHTVSIRMLQKLWESPAVVALAQIAGLGALVGWGCASLARAGVSRGVIVLTSVLFAVVPVNGTMAVTLWKDVPFSFCVLALSVLVFRSATDPTLRWGWRFWVGVIVLGAMAMLLRHNGLPAVVGTFLALGLLRRGRYKSVALALVAAVVVTAGTRALLSRTYTIKPFPKGMTLVGFLGAHVAAGTPLAPEERALLEELHPLDDKWNYRCFSNVYTIWDGRFDMAALTRHSDALLPLLVRLTRRDAGPVLSHVLCSSSVLWKLSQGGDLINGPPIWVEPDGRMGTIEPGEKKLRTTSLLPALREPLLRWTLRTLRPDLAWLLWRPALPFYLLLLACAVACIRHRTWRLAAVALPAVLHTAALAALIPSPDVRYQYPVFLVALMFVPAWLAGARLEASPAAEAPPRSPSAPHEDPALRSAV
ncbi:hypothetical protein [Corallococcus macrosporus]|uniref:Uncharacterized protein n=1 Tax=Corallococcus macrosporus DSM 14697 TaxID=1189310 RepID=A0A250JZE9_9BACT|nr:hypothetical protein [Corallococcus macrosporus]ATB48877.1 hypothetical protein MYMAC_004508 [Corallococcus macrosporus DSM 14697]